MRLDSPDLMALLGCSETLATTVMANMTRRVGCCDSSKNRHATEHFHATRHPLGQSAEPGEDWLWCHEDEVMLEPGRGPLWRGHWRRG